MLLKAVTLFLIAMMVLGMFGKLRFPKLPKMTKRGQIPTARKCKTCGKYILDGKPCSCGNTP